MDFHYIDQFILVEYASGSWQDNSVLNGCNILFQVTRDLERGTEDAKYYQEVMGPRQLANFRPFNLEEWWARRLLQSINRNKHRS